MSISLCYKSNQFKQKMYSKETILTENQVCNAWSYAISCGKRWTIFNLKFAIQRSSARNILKNILHTFHRCRKNHYLGILFTAKQFTVCKRHSWGVTGGYNIESVYHTGHYKLKLLNKTMIPFQMYKICVLHRLKTSIYMGNAINIRR